MSVCKQAGRIQRAAVDWAAVLGSPDFAGLVSHAIACAVSQSMRVGSANVAAAAAAAAGAGSRA